MESTFLPISERPVDSLRAGDFHLTEAVYPAAYRVPSHRHESAYITFVVRGRLEEVVAGRSERLEPRGMVLKPAGMVHSNRFGHTGAQLLLVEILPSLSEGSAGVTRVLENVCLAQSPRVAQLMLRVYGELRGQDTYSGLSAEGLLLETFAELARATVPRAAPISEPYLERVRDRLHADFARPLRIAQLARDESISPARLARQFRTRFGQGIGEYLRQIRLDWIAQALLRTERPIALLAAEAGFADQSHLTRDFRRAFGATPAVFRRSAVSRRRRES